MVMIEIKIKQYNKSDGDRELLKCVSRTCENTYSCRILDFVHITDFDSVSVLVGSRI